jgi:TonB family protein
MARSPHPHAWKMRCALLFASSACSHQPAAARSVDTRDEMPAKSPADDSRVAPPRMVSGPDPEYTPEALRQGVEGRVDVKCVIDTAGTVKDCYVTKSTPSLDDAMVKALLQRKYEPALIDGRPVAVDYTFTVTFRLRPTPADVAIEDSARSGMVTISPPGKHVEFDGGGSCDVRVDRVVGGCVAFVAMRSPQGSGEGLRRLASCGEWMSTCVGAVLCNCGGDAEPVTIEEAVQEVGTARGDARRALKSLVDPSTLATQPAHR